ncbi:hypothetical protein FISHEDRAFT_77490 [Fistulina hepatica ATCC 64428]|uniref:Uncharacterized protein n=1 Tax=Fistulina hepatica ATCC 64428 TaxID=1128425 RepID=A0A0D7A3U6_9AGAR|nr:hypothetical protein FISHEDRAFT_77490 [Fistulina hepatica ATCC 64428]
MYVLPSKQLYASGVQEALVRQVDDLSEFLGETWSWYAAGPDDVVDRRHIPAVTPFDVSKYPGTGFYRICTVTVRGGGDSSGAYQITTGSLDPVAINKTFAETYAVRHRRVSNNFATLKGFTAPDDTDWSRIDFIFANSSSTWTVDATTRTESIHS